MSAGLTGLPGLHAELRPAAADDPAHDRAAPALGGGARHDRRGVRAEARRRPRGADPGRGPGDGGGVHRRAGDGRGRRARPSCDVLRARSRRCCAATTCS